MYCQGRSVDLIYVKENYKKTFLKLSETLYFQEKVSKGRRISRNTESLTQNSDSIKPSHFHSSHSQNYKFYSLKEAHLKF